MLRRAGRGSINPVLIEKTVPQSLWRNGIARWTSNPEAPGSSPGRDVDVRIRLYFFFPLMRRVKNKAYIF